jgi:hypothetical protein
MDRASKLRLDYTEMLLRSYSRRLADPAAVRARSEAKLREPRRAQEATLQAILKRHAPASTAAATGSRRSTATRPIAPGYRWCATRTSRPPCSG